MLRQRFSQKNTWNWLAWTSVSTGFSGEIWWFFLSHATVLCLIIPRSTVEKHSYRGLLVFWYFVPHTCGVLRNCRRKAMYSQCSCLWCVLTAMISLAMNARWRSEEVVDCWEQRTHQQDTRNRGFVAIFMVRNLEFSDFLRVRHSFCPLGCKSAPWVHWVYFLRSIFWHARVVQHRRTNSGTLADDDNVVVFTNIFSWNAQLARRKTTFSWAILLIEARKKPVWRWPSTSECVWNCGIPKFQSIEMMISRWMDVFFFPKNIRQTPLTSHGWIWVCLKVVCVCIIYIYIYTYILCP